MHEYLFVSVHASILKVSFTDNANAQRKTRLVTDKTIDSHGSRK